MSNEDVCIYCGEPIEIESCDGVDVCEECRCGKHED